MNGFHEPTTELSLSGSLILTLLSLSKIKIRKSRTYTPINIDQIGINSDSWIDELKGFKSIGFSAVGTAEQLKEFSAKTLLGKDNSLPSQSVKQKQQRVDRL